MITVTLYSRHDCHLCEVALADLEALQDEIPHRVVVVDVDSDAALARAYGEKVPVLEVGPYRKEAPFTRQELKITLLAASDRAGQLARLDEAAQVDGKPRRVRPQRKTPGWADRFSYWLTGHYLAVFNLLVFIYVGVPFLAPVFMQTGWTRPARAIYWAYSGVCHQFAFRSWFLFGEQAVYPRQAAGVERLKPYGEVTGLNEGDVFAARRFIGDERVGYKVAFCERDVAIYGGILLFGLLFAATRRRIPPLPWYLWILLGIMPIAVDGVSQLISQPPFALLTYRESTPFLRSLTGGLFGFMTAWFGYGMVDAAMQDTRRMLAVKFARARADP